MMTLIEQIDALQELDIRFRTLLQRQREKYAAVELVILINDEVEYLTNTGKLPDRFLPTLIRVGAGSVTDVTQLSMMYRALVLARCGFEKTLSQESSF
jgi:hypothetical protein